MSIPKFKHIDIHYLVTHHVGNKHREEALLLSDESTQIDGETIDYLLKYFLHPFKSEEYYAFTHPMGLDMNPIYKTARKIFENQDTLVDDSRDIARLLYEATNHPQIKKGELNVAYFTEIHYEGQSVDGIGIFKSESQVPFLKMQYFEKIYEINHDFGFELNSIDKACLILNSNAEEGYRVLLLDNINKQQDARYWRDDFLKLTPISNEFHQTQRVMAMTHEYLNDQLATEFPINRAEQIDLMNKSVDYFKSHDNFDKNDFAEEVLGEPEMIQAYKQFDQKYQDDYEVDIPGDFMISNQAVKKYSRNFKSVLKLDKNFHVYIHGDRELIELCYDDDGRKYYKIYFEEEH